MRVFVLAKKDVYVFICLLISICFVLFLLNKMYDARIVETNASPILNKTIVLDAGHRPS